MVSKAEVGLMSYAYGLMYTIENTLRNIISDVMKSFYGENWYKDAPKSLKRKPYKKSFERLYFHELIPFLSIYSCFTSKINDNNVKELQIIIAIRNKIAHSIYLTDIEIEKLKGAYNIILELANSADLLSSKEFSTTLHMNSKI